MLDLPNQLLCWVLSTSDQCFVSFQPIWCHPHTQTRIILFDGVRISIPKWKPSPNRTSIGFFQIAFPIIVLPKDDRTDSAQEEQLGLRYWTMISAICVVVDESTCLDIPIWEFSIIWEHPPFLPGYKLIPRPLLVHRNLAIWRWYPRLLLLSLVMLMILVQWILHKNRIVFYNITSEYNLTFVFLVLCLQFSIFQMTYVHQWGEMNFCAFRPCFIDHLFLTFDFRQLPRRKFLQFFTSLSTAAFAAGICIAWRIGINLWTNL